MEEETAKAPADADVAEIVAFLRAEWLTPRAPAGRGCDRASALDPRIVEAPALRGLGRRGGR